MEEREMKTIDTMEALDLFTKMYSEKHNGQLLEPGEKTIAILKNCTLIVELTEDKELKMEFLGSEPIYIDENLDMYVTDGEDDEDDSD